MTISMPPCPFCEGPPVPICTKLLGGGVINDDQIPEEGIDAAAYVFCHECGAQGPIEDAIICDARERAELTAKAVAGWIERNSRHRDLYDSSAKNGLNLYPRPNEDAGGKSLH